SWRTSSASWIAPKYSDTTKRLPKVRGRGSMATERERNSRFKSIAAFHQWCIGDGFFAPFAAAAFDSPQSAATFRVTRTAATVGPWLAGLSDEKTDRREHRDGGPGRCIAACSSGCRGPAGPPAGRVCPAPSRGDLYLDRLLFRRPWRRRMGSENRDRLPV